VPSEQVIAHDLGISVRTVEVRRIHGHLAEHPSGDQASLAPINGSEQNRGE
jgi:hypothetical protein